MSANEATVLEERLSKAAVVIRRLKEKMAILEGEERRRFEPIAITGIGCRFPGGSDSPEAFWALLESGRDAVKPLDERWKLVGSRPSDDAPSWAGILAERIDAFDPAFFGISAREAAAMDPQQRLLLEVTWEALENAAIVPQSLEQSATGVFVGVCSNDYQHVLMRHPPEERDLYTTTGNMSSVVAGRVAYTFGLQGPCMMIDTACSSSLVATHLACQSLRTGECDVALAGGVNLLLSPLPTEAAHRMQALSPDGRCRTFDAGANGFVRGEGCGVVVLKRLSDARRAGDRIWGLIRGSAVNQDGRSTGLTAPNVLAQQALLRQALENARVAPESIGYVETHGTGTSLGDPIEVDALRAVVGPARPDGTRCMLGALKTHIGHLEGAAGIAGLIKAVLVLDRERIPANLNFRTLNPRIRLEGTALVPASEAAPWPRADRPRYAGVSSFGLSGTNAHVVLEEAPEAQAPASAPTRPAELLVVSAKSEEALKAQAARLAGYLRGHEELELGDVALSLATTRSAMEQRLAVAAGTREEALRALEAAAKGETPAYGVRGRATGGTGKVAFVFPGQGSQWLGMGRTLLEEEPAFRSTMEDCDRAIQAEAGFSVLEELRAEEGRSQLGRGDVMQPVLFAMEVALGALWQAWGVKPDAVVGHSMGEVAAAHMAGALTLEEAAAVICRRSRLMQRISGQGEVALVELTVKEAEAALRGYQDRLSVAGSNSPRFTVLSGEPGALREVLGALEKRGVFQRRVKMDVASHSPQVEPLREELVAALKGLKPKVAAVPMRSTVSCGRVEGPELGAEYWAENMRKPVWFAQAVEGLIEEGHTVFVEMSPHPILQPSVEEILGSQGKEGVAVGSLRRGQEERRTLLESLGALWVRGHPVAWDRQFPSSGRRVPLPTYAWGDRERHWLETPEPIVRRGHPLLGESTPSSLSEGVTYWTNDLSTRTTRYLEEHRVGGQVVFPAAGYVEMAIQAATEELGGPVELEDFEIDEALLFAGDECRVVQLALRREGAQAARWQIASTGSGAGVRKWTVHARGRAQRVAPAAQELETPEALLQRAKAESWDAFDGEALYARMLEGGVDYGRTFRGVQRGWRRTGEALAELACVGEVAKRDGVYGIHPGLLDAALQVIAAAQGEEEGGLYLPVGMKQVYVARPPEGWNKRGKLWGHARSVREGGELRSDLWVRAASGEVLARIVGFRARHVQGIRQAANESSRWLYEIHWEEMDQDEARSGAEADQRNWVVFMDSGGALDALIVGLTAQGRRVLQVRKGDAFVADDGTGRASLEARDGGSYARLLQDLPAEFREKGWGILHGWSLDDSLEDAAAAAGAGPGWRSLLQLVQAVAGRDAGDQPRIVAVTRGARSVVPEDRLSGLAQTPVIGLCKTLVLEHPELPCLCVDAGETAGGALHPADLGALLNEMGWRRREEEIALRSGRLFVPRLVRSAPRADEEAEPSFGPLHPDGLYVITGGLGGLGLALARWIAQSGARHLALLGRRAPGEAALGVIAELRDAEVEVLPLQADVANAESLGGALAGLAAGGRPIRGVFHLAGCLDNAVLSALSPDRFAKVLEPKVQGTWNIHQATQDQPLDMFVLFSSVASVFGAPGQANHAAANAFLDGFAAFRAARGEKALSVNWGAWADAGEAAEEKAAAYVASRGLKAMAPEDALRALARASTRGSVQTAVVAFDRSLLAAGAVLDRPLFSRVVAELGQRTSARDGSEGGLTRKALLEAVPGQRERLVVDFLRDLVATQTGFAKSRVDVQRPLTSLGLDSLMTLNLKNRIEIALGVSVSATLFLQGINTAQLAARIVGMLGGEETATTSAEPSAAASRAAQRRAAQARRAGPR